MRKRASIRWNFKYFCFDDVILERISFAKILNRLAAFLKKMMEFVTMADRVLRCVSSPFLLMRHVHVHAKRLACVVKLLHIESWKQVGERPTWLSLSIRATQSSSLGPIVFMLFPVFFFFISLFRQLRNGDMANFAEYSNPGCVFFWFIFFADVIWIEWWGVKAVWLFRSRCLSVYLADGIAGYICMLRALWR